MDFWTRLLGTSLSSGNSRRDDAKNPAKRLHRFDKEFNHVLHLWRTASNLAQDDDRAEAIEIRLHELTNILSDEARKPLPHPCIQYAAKKQIYVPIGKIATTSYNEWIIKETVNLFATLVETDEESFVSTPSFSASVTNFLVRITGLNSIRLGSDTEAEVVELAFSITTKIRMDRSILPAWFEPQRDRDDGRTDPQSTAQDKRKNFVGRTQKQDFPLFYILMDYIHQEGKVGDFARTGLLYIIEAAASSESLEQWIVESDLSTLMATGLGALYSQLSRKLVIDHLPHDLPPVLALSDYQHPVSNQEIVSSCSAEFQLHLQTFLSHLLFWQDVLEHCKSVEIKQTLLEHFQVIFLQQLLYPSLLESSDIDGGSSVAVLTYLRRILESLDHPDMVHLILHYLLGLSDRTPPDSADDKTTISDARKRKSMDLASMLAQTQSDLTATPLLFNLVDLILACLRSQNQQTIHVTLQLVSAILKRHHRYAVMTILRTEGVVGERAHRTVGAHEQEVDFFVNLVGCIGGRDNFDEVYENILKDTMARLESHPCSLKLVAPRLSIHNHQLPAIPDGLPGAPRSVREHTLRPDDPLLNTLLDLLETFFLNPVDTNLSLTETIVNLATCGYMTVEGWLLRNPQKYTYDEQPADSTSPTSPTPTSPGGSPVDAEFSSAAELQKIQAIKDCQRRPIWAPPTLPRFLTLLQKLCNQVSEYRGCIPRFDDLLQQRREAFHTTDAAQVPATPRPNRKPTPHQQGSTLTPDGASPDALSRSASPARPSGIEGFAQRLLSDLGTPGRGTNSPRGAKEQQHHRGSGAASPTPGAGSLAGGGSHGVATPTGRPTPPPKDYPPHVYEGPAKGGERMRSISPGSGSMRIATQEDVVANQMAAFTVVDQSILSRRVGIPHNVEAIPLRLEREQQQTSGAEQATPHIPPPKDDDPQEDDVGGEEEEAESGEGEDGMTRDKDGELGESAEDGERDEEGEEGEETARMASVSHVITNVLIFQSFLLELAALVQVRASLFDEVRFV
ncbi:hypothetical protein SODALDRAFT_348345 [Sodiomyces alkalinus F11]|uniref:FHF complex subunit HOOK-interacting protein C-terminal domain-containing protein n=1 Tax=Sodiomyces alkalinus (strain CBS 110278 / VKM F-3762 / F11) TaxID=1314773 RepID=A0A3N2QAA8_SODAK|nr:hypothetical protein SODALDRAFT_348345 [Sodiomyces alkalinus F11]ROT43682.1 hypothetical protein SODALDRAFT_348345 [Sodiomyces alkalinus F11]